MLIDFRVTDNIMFFTTNGLIFGFILLYLSFQYYIYTTIFDIPLKETIAPKQENFTKNVCRGTVFHGTCTENGVWELTDEEEKIYVVSAYKNIESTNIFVIGTLPFGRKPVYCQVWSPSRYNRHEIVVEKKAVIQKQDMYFEDAKYIPTLFMCPLPSSEKDIYVSLATKKCKKPNNIMCVYNASKPDVYERHFTACLQIKSRDVTVSQLVEWIEMNKLLGVDMFFIYSFEQSDNIQRVINFYKNRSLVEEILWYTPTAVSVNASHLAALNDCLYRNKNVSEFVTNIDEDELIIPRSVGVYNWHQMITQIQTEADAFVFRNAFFICRGYNSTIDPADALVRPRPHILDDVQREKFIYPVGYFSKYICRTDSVYWVQTHFVPDVRMLSVPRNIGLLHHYQNKTVELWNVYYDDILTKKYKTGLETSISMFQRNFTGYSELFSGH